MKIIDTAFEFGDIVYLKTDSDQKKRIITGILMKADGICSFECTCGTEGRWHYAVEISLEKDVLTSTTN